jgi:hypothetical protein
MSGVAVPDFGNFFNAIAKHPKPPPKPSRVTFDVHWHGGGDRQQVSDTTYGFAGEFVDGPATISFTAKNDAASVVYRSLAAKQTVKYAGAGHERNGVFFA